MCVKHGVDIIYRASYIDAEGMDMLEKNKEKHIVAPAINWLYNTVYEASAFGYTLQMAEKAGYKEELEVAIKALREMRRRGITVLPGGDYGFSWTPHGTHARDLEHFVKLLDFTPTEALIAATAGVATLFMRQDEMGKIKPGYFADVILVGENPLEDITILQKHDRLDIIMINGRLHKASYEEFAPQTSESMSDLQGKSKLNNFVVYRLQDGTCRTRIGHIDQKAGTIVPISFASGTPVDNLYQIIEVGEEHIIAGGDPFELTESVDILAPLSERDVLAVGKNYSEHAREFNESGYDSSDKIDMPSHPVIFTKRATSIIANEEKVLWHKDFTDTLDYEGEIGVIIGKGGFQIAEHDAQQHVWGYTIINDITAREKQRDHKQFYIGKSGDSYCPMGPMALPKSALPDVLTVATHVNGQLRQKGNTQELIFSIPKLISTLSASQTLRPGDVIATGTPAGVGFGLKPPVFLKPDDVVEVSVTGLGTLRNKVVEALPDNHVVQRVMNQTHISTNNLNITSGGFGLTSLPNGKQLYAKVLGSGPQTIVFIHGLGGTHTFFAPVVESLVLDSKTSDYTTLLYDLEGHGLSPTRATSILSIEAYASDLFALVSALSLPTSQGITLVAHSMGCLIASLLTTQRPDLISNLILLGPAPCPLPAAAADASLARAATVRRDGSMRELALAVAKAAVSPTTQRRNPVAYAAVQGSLISQDPEGYAKGCTALAGAKDLQIDFGTVGKAVRTLLITGEDDKVAPPAHVEKLGGIMGAERKIVLEGVGHWHIFEDAEGTGRAIREFLKVTM